MSWRDVTSYSQGDKERVPRSWEWKRIGPPTLRILVHRLIGLPGWYLTCFDVNLRDMGLGDDLEKAKANALKMVRVRLAAWAEMVKER